jgi:carboxyl-terminal processing protease
MKGFLWVLLALVVLAGGSYAGWLYASGDPIGHLPLWVQVRPSIYLDTALDRIQSGAYGRATIDWPTVRARATAISVKASSADETYGAIRATLDALPDHLSLLVEPPAVATAGRSYGLQVLFPERIVAIVYPNSAAAAAGIHPGDVVVSVEGHPPMVNHDARARGHFIEIPPPSTELRLRPVSGAPRDVPLAVSTYALLPADTHRIGGDLGYVFLPATSGTSSFVQAVQSGIAAADAPTLCGWIVDLRAATGGSLEPMLQALGAIIGPPPIGSSVDASGARTPWSYPAGSPSATPLAHPQGPVAVLTSRLTASAAEGLVVAFRGRVGARSFGEPTWGTPTTSLAYALADGAQLQLTQAFDADRSGQTYKGPIAPDEPVPVDWARLGTPEDPVIVAAGTWLRTQCRK